MLAPQSIELNWAEAPPVALERKPRRPEAEIPAICRSVAFRLLHHNAEYQHCIPAPGHDGLCDFLFVTPDEPHSAEQVFSRLRWGGLCLFASPHRRQVEELAGEYQKYGMTVEQGPATVRDGWCGLPFLSRKIHGLVARKVELLPPGQTNHRFTYQVQLSPHFDAKEPIVVLKQVPSLESVIERLKKKHPEYPDRGVERLARKFVHRIFPTFLTREAGILLILQEHLPPPYNQRVPRLISMEKDERGFVQRLKMSWLRNGGEPLTHMEFARQSADLLRALHDIPHIIHMDLRLDNFVITPNGVGFVDFGSAVRESEDLSRNPLLQTLFSDLMRTSQIQQMMEKMTISGQVTSQVIRSGCHKPDKAADYFYLALQFNSPHVNPDLAAFIEYDPKSPEARELAGLTSQILRPPDPAHPKFRSAKDILHGIERLQLGLDRN